MTGKIEDMLADLIVELRNRLDELERRVSSLELSLGKAQSLKRGSKTKSKRQSR